MIHLYAPPGDFPATACGLTRVWGAVHAAVYGKDIALVNCPDCLARASTQRAESLRVPPEVERSEFRVTVVLWALTLFTVVLWLWIS